MSILISCFFPVDRRQALGDQATLQIHRGIGSAQSQNGRTFSRYSSTDSAASNHQQHWTVVDAIWYHVVDNGGSDDVKFELARRRNVVQSQASTARVAWWAGGRFRIRGLWAATASRARMPAAGRCCCFGEAVSPTANSRKFLR